MLPIHYLIFDDPVIISYSGGTYTCFLRGTYIKRHWFHIRKEDVDKKTN